jgi:hypothetical protein
MVHLALQKLRYPVLSERRLHGLPMQVDVLTRGLDKAGTEHHVVLEVDGPTHFLHSPDGTSELSSVDELKVAALMLHGVTVRLQCARSLRFKRPWCHVCAECVPATVSSLGGMQTCAPVNLERWLPL